MVIRVLSGTLWLEDERIPITRNEFEQFIPEPDGYVSSIGYTLAGRVETEPLLWATTRLPYASDMSRYASVHFDGRLALFMAKAAE